MATSYAFITNLAVTHVFADISLPISLAFAYFSIVGHLVLLGLVWFGYIETEYTEYSAISHPFLL